MIKLFLAILLFSSMPAHAYNATFFYGSPFPQELRIYDAIIVEADHTDFAIVPENMQNKLYAYTSLGEVGSDKVYANAVPVDAKLTRNPAWYSDVMDQASPSWRNFYIDKIIAPLWQRGFRGVFIDTLDAYQLAATTPQQKIIQENGMVETLRQMQLRFPGMRIILNRGFEILPRVHESVTAVVAESLFQGWDNVQHAYTPVNGADRQWLLNQLDHVKNTYHLPVIVIDYVAPQDRQQAREIGKKIRAAGFIPWVSNPELDMLGVGDPEIQPRRILMLFDSQSNQDIDSSEIHRFATMPIQYMGFIPEYIDISQPLPAFQLAGKFAGIIIWANSTQNSSPGFRDWLQKQINLGIKLAVINEFGFERSTENLQIFGLRHNGSVPANNPEIISQDSIVGFEHAPQSHQEMLDLIEPAMESKPILRLKIEGKVSDVAAYMPWGAYVFSPYALYEVPYQQGIRWIINPFDFFKRALNLPDIPAPDMTTSTGRRILMAHMDGDGFANNAEFPGSPLASRVMLDKIFKKYAIPTAVSVIEAETAPWGLYPDKSAEMEQIARETFRLPHVEIASHSFSHPFNWKKLSKEPDSMGYNLKVANYIFDLNKETAGSMNYINERLAPPGKRCRIFLWTGDCEPGPEAIAKTDALNLLNMNGGGTVITHNQPSLTLVAPLGLDRDGHYQVYAPNQNENVYTNNWTGPFYGFRRVIETFQLTNTPRRLKPVDIYFHTYSASKPSSLKSLNEVYTWALKQPNHPLFPSAYIKRVLDFNHSVMARDDNDWLFYGDGLIDTLRMHAKNGYPSMNDSLAGYNDFNEERYLHLVNVKVNRVTLTAKSTHEPFLIDANGSLISWQKNARQIRMTFDSPAVLDFTLGHSDHCRLFDVNGQLLRVDYRSGVKHHYQTRVTGRASYQLNCTMDH